MNKPLAKPSGLSLDEHTEHVLIEGMRICEAFPLTAQKYLEIVGKKLQRRIELACQYHDTGKMLSQKWQNACVKEYSEYLDRRENKQIAFHEYTRLQPDRKKYLQKTGVRHEFFSLEHHVKKNNIPLAIQAAIAAHHGKLSYSDSDRWEKDESGRFQEFWKNFQKESNSLIEKKDFELLFKKHFEYAGVRGLLRLADHRASSKEENGQPPEFKQFSYKFPYPSRHYVQKIVGEHWEDDLLLIRAPTGSGKTDAALLWAQKQIENKRAERLIIAMPTRFTSNALAISVAESLSQTGLYHSSAWFKQFADKVENKEMQSSEADNIHEFSRLLLTPVTVTTIDHLLMALTLTREDHHLITFNLANSCVVIDEADFYDDFSQANILVLLEYLAKMKVPVMLMSATLPEASLPLYKDTGYNVKEILEDKSDNDRIRFELVLKIEAAMPTDVEDLLQQMIENGNGIIYLNTIERAFNFRSWFEKKGFSNVELYHSRFTEPDKALKENKLLEMLGKEAWKGGRASGIAILTQIGEMSINISSNMMISDICPVDRLTQRAGRLCRFDKAQKGKLYILLPYKNNSLFPAPYGSFESGAWVANDAFQKTVERLNTGKYNAEQLVNLINVVYAEMNISVKAKYNADKLRELFYYNWLILPKRQATADATDNTFWKSRDIPPQDTVFVAQPENLFFSDYLRWQTWKTRNQIELPVYLVERALKNGVINIQTITIREDEEQIYILNEKYYSDEKGIDLAAFEKIDKSSFEFL